MSGGSFGAEAMGRILPNGPKTGGGDCFCPVATHCCDGGCFNGEMQSTWPTDGGRPWLLPLLLSAVAGFVDGCTYLGLFGIFVAQATGSFVLVGLELMTSERGAIAKLLAVPSFIAAGMAVTVLVTLMRARPRAALAMSLLLEGALLGGFVLAWMLAQPFRGPDEPGAVAALIFAMTAMGAQSATVRLMLRGLPSTNVMTTNSTLFAINAAELLLMLLRGVDAGDEAQRKARSEFGTVLVIGIGFFAGVLLGAVAYMAIGLGCMLLPIVPVIGLACWYLFRRGGGGVAASAT